MRRKLVLLAAFVVIALVALVIYSTQAQQRQGGPPEGGTPGGAPRQFSGQFLVRSLALETNWSQISLEMNVPNDTLIKAREAFQAAWTKRKAVAAKAEGASDDAARAALRTELDKIKTELDGKLKVILTAKQLEEYTKWEKENQARTQQRMGGGPPRQ